MLTNPIEGYSMNNRKHLLATLICSGAIVASVNVIAQSYGQDSRQRSDNSRGTTMSGDANTRLEPASSAFKRLDSNKRGYLTNEQVRSMQGFDSACDKNTDGRITRSEFRPCWDTWSRNQSTTTAPSVGLTPSTSSSDTTNSNAATGTNSGAGTGTNAGSTGNGVNSGAGTSGTGTSGSGTGNNSTDTNRVVPGSTMPGAGGSGSSTNDSPSNSNSGSGTGTGR